MITFNYQTDFRLENEETFSNWIQVCIKNEGYETGEINYIFCDDACLLQLNIEFLQHDTLTDIISFDNSLGKLIRGDIYISVERVQENAQDFKVSFNDEIRRVMIHGVLHYIGFKDNSLEEKKIMKNKENECLTYWLSVM